MKKWFLASRPHTLTAAVMPVFLSLAIAYPCFRLIATGLALFISLLIQIGTNLVNDACDFWRGADSEKSLGPPSAVVKGIFSPETVYWGGIVAFLLAFSLGVVLGAIAGWFLFFVVSLSILAGYFYTAGPFPTAYYALGDIFIFLFFGLVATVSLTYLQIGVFSLQAFTCGAEVGLLGILILAINNLRDIEHDKEHGKKTFAVLFNRKGVSREIVAVALGPYLLQISLLRSGWEILPLMTLPLAIKIIVSIYQTKPHYNGLIAQAALLHCLYSLLLGFSLFMAK